MVRSGEKADRSAERTPWTWAALAAAIAVGASPAALAQDTRAASPGGAAQPASAEDFVQLEADELINDELAGTVTAQGDVQVRYQGRTLRADQLIYNLNSGAIQAIGGVEIVLEDGSTTYAERIDADEALNVGAADELRARLANDATLAARTALRHGEGESELRNVIYTSCPICESDARPPTWSLRARRAIQDRETRTISYRGAVLEVAGVPVFYWPYFAHPDPSVGRTSGFLTPNIGNNNRLGAFYHQPYYWAISPAQDATVTLRAHGNVNPMVGLDYRRRFWSGELNVETTFTHEAEFGSQGARFGEEKFRGSVFADGRFRINEHWQWGFGAEHASDDLYLRRYDVDGPGELRGPYYGYDTRLISQLYTIGQSENSYTSVSMLAFQGLRATDAPFLMPAVLPYADTEYVFNDPLLNGQVRLQGNAVMLVREDNATLNDSGRVSASATWRRDLIVGPGVVVSPFAQARGDYYHVETSPGDFESFGRSLGLAGAEISWPFMRPGERFDFVVEPVITAVYASEDGDDPRIVNEDSLAFELDDSSLFRPNGAPNYDLWEPGGRVSAGVRATARNRAGQSATLTFGRRWRDEPAPGFGPRTNLHQEASDWVGSGQLNLGRVFSSEARVRLDDDLEIQRLDVAARTRAGRFSASAYYFQIEESLAPGNPNRQLSGQLGVEIAGGWRMAARLIRDLDSDTNLRQDIRAIYEDDCTFFEISYSRRETIRGALGPDESIQFRIGLRSLGLFGGN